jgi:hypothetical protein
MNIMGRIKTMMGVPKHDLSQLQSGLRTLVEQLEDVLEIVEVDPLSALVQFFNITSVWHDRRLKIEIEHLVRARAKDKKHDSIILKLVTLDQQFVATGRDQYGWNRTKIGEIATDENVWIGNIYGMPTKPISYWRQLDPNEPADSWFETYKNPHGAVTAQARKFITNHIPVMIERARELIDY